MANKALKLTAFPWLVCGLTLCYHKTTNSKAAAYRGAKFYTQLKKYLYKN